MLWGDNMYSFLGTTTMVIDKWNYRLNQAIKIAE